MIHTRVFKGSGLHTVHTCVPPHQQERSYAAMFAVVLCATRIPLDAAVPRDRQVLYHKTADGFVTAVLYSKQPQQKGVWSELRDSDSTAKRSGTQHKKNKTYCGKKQIDRPTNPHFVVYSLANKTEKKPKSNNAPKIPKF